MRKRDFGMCIFTISVVLLLLVGATYTLPKVQARGNSQVDPWGQKGVLNYLFWTADPKLEQDVVKLQRDLRLDDDTIAKMKELGLEERQGVDKFVVGANMSLADAFNNAWKSTFSDVDAKTRALLGDKYEPFRAWVRAWWQQETQYRTQWLQQKMQENGEF